ncbi:MAG: S9 family peptidase [Verrucomicrobia bacterium]|nr:S9 family peptidase [Verrucomicrobiota bacterium]
MKTTLTPPRRFSLGLVAITLGLSGGVPISTAPPARAEAKPPHPITAEDLWAVQRIAALSLSPDGGTAVVEVTSYDVSENAGSSDLWLLATDGRSQRRLTTHKARDSAPAWSPDGRTIAFLSKRDDDDETQIYLIAVEGGEARRLTKISTGASALKWFPDGSRVAFVSWVWPDLKTDDEQAKRLKERKDAKVKAHIIDTTNFRYWDHWLADGRVAHVFAVDVKTDETRDLLAGTDLSLIRWDESRGLSADLYDISPDSAELALTVDLTKDPGFDPSADIVTLPVAGGAWKNLTTDNPANDAKPRYSPDGKAIAFTKQAIKNFYADRRRLVLHERMTGTQRELTEHWDRSVEAFHWASDSRALFFLAEDKARQPIWRLALEAAEPKPIVQDGTIQAFAASANGRTLAFVRSTMGRPPGVFAAAADGTSARQIETFNDDLVKQWKLGEVKEVTFAGWNGAPMQMWVIYPPNFDPQKKWPLLQIVHGGPHSAWMDQFHFRWNMQLFASRGHVVAAVNFHGSTGWGQAFTDASTAQYGTKEFEDVEKGTDHLIAQGYIDPARLAAAGGSYGGYMVAWMNGHTDRYKAYVCHAGVYDWVSQMASDTVRGRERALGAFPWEDPQKVLAQSAHSYAKNFKTPTLVVHGENDYRVPVGQGFEYYTTLRMLGVPSRLLYFPDENHWVLKPQNSLLWYKEFFDWIEKHVGAGPS